MTTASSSTPCRRKAGSCAPTGAGGRVTDQPPARRPTASSSRTAFYAARRELLLPRRGLMGLLSFLRQRSRPLLLLLRALLLRARNVAAGVGTGGHHHFSVT